MSTRPAIAVFVLCAAAGAAEPQAFVETRLARAECYAGEPLRVVLRIGYDKAFFERGAVQMFHRELDLPLQVRAPFLDRVEGAAMRPARDPADGPTLVLNARVVRARERGEEERDGHRYAMVEIERTILPGAAGVLEFAAPELRYVWTTGFRDDFVGGRVPVDRHDAVVTGEVVRLPVAALPEDDRPADFCGAVGRNLRLTAGVDPLERSGAAGPDLRLTLEITGDANLERFETPRLSSLLPGFHIFSRMEQKTPESRTITCELARTDPDATAIPAIPLTWFDTTPPAGYRTTKTPPITLAPKPTPPSRHPPLLPWLALLVVVVLVGTRYVARRS